MASPVNESGLKRGYDHVGGREDNASMKKINDAATEVIDNTNSPREIKRELYVQTEGDKSKVEDIVRENSLIINNLRLDKWKRETRNNTVWRGADDKILPYDGSILALVEGRMMSNFKSKDTTLDLSGINFTDRNFPNEPLTKLQHIEHLDLSETYLTRVPDGVTQLRNLKTLDLSKTNIKEKPNLPNVAITIGGTPTPRQFVANSECSVQ